MPEVKLYFTVPCEGGTLKIAYDAVASTARESCLATNGVASMAAVEAPIADWFESRGVLLTQDEDGLRCKIALYITVELGEPIAEIAAAVQDNVKAAVEATSALKVSSIDVYVAGISFPK